MQLLQGDCLELLPKLIDTVQVDLVLVDPPYGTIKGLDLQTDNFTNDKTQWDIVLPFQTIFGYVEKLLKVGHKFIVFSQEPLTCKIRTISHYPFEFVYPMIWKKNNFGNFLGCNKSPVSYYEDITVFNKKHDSNSKHPLRTYSQKLLECLRIDYKETNHILGHRKAEHFLYRINSSQFTLCTEETYNELIRIFKIDKLDCFIPYSDLKKVNDEYSGFIFNKTGKYKSNILEYPKESKSYHPTQKPVALLEDIIKTYTNEGDVVLDFTMGSGSTGVACLNTNRHFIGMELNQEYFDIATQRIEKAKGGTNETGNT